MVEHVIADARGRVVVEQVDRKEARAPVTAHGGGAAELGREVAQALLAASDKHERGSGLAGEPARGGLADAAGGAGNQHDFGHWALAFQIGNTMSSPTPSGAGGVASSDRESTYHGSNDQRSARKREAIELFRGLPRRYDALSAALSFWQDPRWRRALVSAAAPEPGQRIVDVATGTGMVAAELLARADCSVVGLDQSREMLAVARTRFAAARAFARRALACRASAR